MDFLKLLEEYENYKRSFGIEPKSSGHSACVDFAAWLNQNASQQGFAPDAEAVCVCGEDLFAVNPDGKCAWCKLPRR